MAYIRGPLPAYAASFNCDDLGFLACGKCDATVDAFHPSTEQYACQTDHLICNQCALTTTICPKCDTLIERVTTIEDTPTRHPSFYCRRLIHHCPNKGCAFFHLNPANIRAHALVSCAFKLPPHTPKKHSNAFKSDTHTCAINVSSYIPTCTAVFTSQFTIITELLFDFNKHTITPHHIQFPMYVLCQSPTRTSFFILDPSVPVRERSYPFHFSHPIAETLTIRIHPLFYPYPENPDAWSSLEHSFSCNSAVAHWQQSFTDSLKSFSVSVLEDPSVHPPLHQLRQPFGVAMNPAAAQLILSAMQVKFESPPATTLFLMPQTQTTSPFHFHVIYMPDNTRAFIICPACAGLFTMHPSGSSSFSQHVHIDHTLLQMHARRVDTASLAPIRNESLTPCARRLWRSDLAYQLNPPAHRAFTDLFPMHELLTVRKQLRQSLPNFYGTYITIDKTDILAAVSITIATALDEDDTPSIIASCAMCHQNDIDATPASIAQHFNLSVDIIPNFRAIIFNHSLTEYQFNDADRLVAAFTPPRRSESTAGSQRIHRSRAVSSSL